MKYTKEQRRDIYLKAAEKIFLSHKDCCCWAIQKAAGYKDNMMHRITSITCEQFEEFALFKPREENGAFGMWWFHNDYDSRIFALLLCSEMCK